jgi:hypothetical protein
VYCKGDMVVVKPTFSSYDSIGVIIDIDPDPAVKLKYLILVRGMYRMLWYMESEIVQYVKCE